MARGHGDDGVSNTAPVPCCIAATGVMGGARESRGEWRGGFSFSSAAARREGATVDGDHGTPA
jgi:hypothetical protein